MRPENNTGAVGQAVATKSQLAGDILLLRRLWSGLYSTEAVIARATKAYQETCGLLKKINGFPNAPILSDIHSPDQV
jgi:hypothetical protein